MCLHSPPPYSRPSTAITEPLNADLLPALSRLSSLSSMAPSPAVFPTSAAAVVSLSGPESSVRHRASPARCACKGIRRCLQCHSAVPGARLAFAEKSLDNVQTTFGVITSSHSDFVASAFPPLAVRDNGAAYLQWQHRADCPPRPAGVFMCLRPRRDPEETLLKKNQCQRTGRRTSACPTERSRVSQPTEPSGLVVSELHAGRSRRPDPQFDLHTSSSHAVRAVDCNTDSQALLESNGGRRVLCEKSSRAVGPCLAVAPPASPRSGHAPAESVSGGGWAVRARRFLKDSHASSPGCWEGHPGIAGLRKRAEVPGEPSEESRRSSGGQGTSGKVKATPARGGDPRGGEPLALTLYFVWCPDCGRLHRQVAEPTSEDFHAPEDEEEGEDQATADERGEEGPIQKSGTCSETENAARPCQLTSQKSAGRTRTCRILQRFCVVEGKGEARREADEGGRRSRAHEVVVETCGDTLSVCKRVEAEVGELSRARDKETSQKKRELQHTGSTGGPTPGSGGKQPRAQWWPLLQVEIAGAVSEALLGSPDEEEDEHVWGEAEDECAKRAPKKETEEGEREENERAGVRGTQKTDSRLSRVTRSTVGPSTLAAEVIQKLLHLLGLSPGAGDAPGRIDGGPRPALLAVNQERDGTAPALTEDEVESSEKTTCKAETSREGERGRGRVVGSAGAQEEAAKRWFDAMFGVFIFPDALSRTAEAEIIAWADASRTKRQKSSRTGMATSNGTHGREKRTALLRTDGQKMVNECRASRLDLVEGADTCGNEKEQHQPEGVQEISEGSATCRGEEELSGSWTDRMKGGAIVQIGYDPADERRARAEGRGRAEGDKDEGESYWSESQSGRRKIEFGAQVNFKKKKVKLAKFTGLPPFSRQLLRRLSDLGARAYPAVRSPQGGLCSTGATPSDSGDPSAHPVRCSGESSLSSSLPASFGSPPGESRSDVWRYLMEGFRPVDLCLLDYSPRRGSHIEEHFDDEWLWGPRLVTYNLVSETFLSFVSPVFCVPCQVLEQQTRPWPGWGSALFSSSSAAASSANSCQCSVSLVRIRVEVRFLLPRRSLVVFQGPSRYTWTHAIRAHHIQKRRLAITLRELSAAFLPGGEHQEVGQAMLEIAGAVSWQPNNVRGERQYEKGCGGGVKKEQGNVQAL